MENILCLILSATRSLIPSLSSFVVQMRKLGIKDLNELAHGNTDAKPEIFRVYRHQNSRWWGKGKKHHNQNTNADSEWNM